MIILFCITAALFTDTVIQTVDIDEKNILAVYSYNNESPAIIFYKETEGFISTITEYFIRYKNEVLGPFDDIVPKFSPDGKTVYVKNGKIMIRE